MRAAQQKRFNEWSKGKMFFAFSDEQFNEGMAGLGLDPEKDLAQLCRIPGGGFLLKKYREEMHQLFDESDAERQAAIDADPDGTGFVYEMFYWELANHEYGYTEEPEETFDALGYDWGDILKDPKLTAGFRKASAKIIGEGMTDNLLEYMSAQDEPIAPSAAAGDLREAGPIRPGNYQLLVTRAVNSAMAGSEDMAKAVFEAVGRFNAGDWGNLDQEDKDANNADLLAREGHVLARYETPAGDVYIELIFDEPSMQSDIATVMFCEER